MLMDIFHQIIIIYAQLENKTNEEKGKNKTFLRNGVE